MCKKNKERYSMTEDDLKALKKTIEYVKKLDFINESDKNIKEKKLNKVA